MVADKEIIKGETKEEAYIKVKEKYGKEVADMVHIWKWGKNSYLATVDKNTLDGNCGEKKENKCQEND